ncbi:helicase-related protein [Moorellaceae bacterium AZ2]
MDLISPCLNLGTAFFLLQYLQERWAESNHAWSRVDKVLQEAARRWRVSLARRPAPAAQPLPPEKEAQIVGKALTGRILLLEEVDLALQENGVRVTSALADLLHYLYLQGECELRPAVGFNARGIPFCYRCGQGDKLYKGICGACGSPHCYVCEGCLELGEARTCRPLYARPRPEKPGLFPCRTVSPRLSFSLTRAQEEAALQARAFVEEGRSSRCLIWAACGAGKTEVAYGALEAALSRGREVLYACPRRETVKEIYRRLQQAFPGVEMTVLHGESGRKYTPAQLVAATTHQVLRCYQRFDLIILDEVDAFPLAGDSRLYYGLERSLRPRGQVLYMTATPSPELAAQARRGQLPVIYLPARPHGYPLPEPQIILARSLRRPGGRLPRQIAECLHSSIIQDRASLLVFVPTVDLVAEVVSWLLGSWEAGGMRDWARGCHAALPEREQVLTAFRRGDFPLLVSTTLLERGITLPRLNVMVLFAHHRRIFDQNTLVQIAGRAGRTAAFPQGRVWFVADRITPEMAEACRIIRSFNRLAFQRGYLRPGRR